MRQVNAVVEDEGRFHAPIRDEDRPRRELRQILPVLRHTELLRSCPTFQPRGWRRRRQMRRDDDAGLGGRFGENGCQAQKPLFDLSACSTPSVAAIGRSKKASTLPSALISDETRFSRAFRRARRRGSAA